jgi:hypothetical protein
LINNLIGKTFVLGNVSKAKAGHFNTPQKLNINGLINKGEILEGISARRKISPLLDTARTL